MMDKIVEYSVRFAVPQSKLSQHQKNFESLIHKLVNTNSSMKNTDIVSIKKLSKEIRCVPYDTSKKHQKLN